MVRRRKSGQGTIVIGLKICKGLFRSRKEDKEGRKESREERREVGRKEDKEDWGLVNRQNLSGNMGEQTGARTFQSAPWMLWTAPSAASDHRCLH